MLFDKPALEELNSESDVEQKFVFPLLTGDAPTGFGNDSANIHTKINIRKFRVGKGVEQKSYYPDFIITRGTIPLLVVEVKSPGSDLQAALREARLYAHELNAVYPKGINPLQKVIATDGTRMLASTVDSAEPLHDLSHDDFAPYSMQFAALLSDFGGAALDRDYARSQSLLRPKRYWKPRRMVGGAAIQQEEVGLNSFGATISADFAHIFNPLSRSDRALIATKAYVSSKRRERYVEPIDRVIRASTPSAEARSHTIDDTASPTEIIKKLRGQRPLEHQVLLIIGSAGAGKTTFVDHLQEVALPRDVRAKTLWVHIDMNPAPISRAEIYDWLRREIVKGCEAAHPEIDFDELETIKLIHSVEVNQYRKGIGRLYEKNAETYNMKLAEHLTAVDSDLHKRTVNYIRFLSTERKKLLIIVLDNCDKRLREEQLLMFEAAQWLQREFRTLVVLPLREETYDNHRNEPPLDTALKDLVFRIEPPLFQRVLFSRIQLAMSSIQKSGQRTLSYKLPNGMNVQYPASDQAFYLSSIMRSIFEHDLHIRRLIVGLSGRNMRRALEIFLEFCTSGHIGEDDIFRIRKSEGQHVLPLGLVTTVLLRLNLRFYNSDRAYLKNIYAAYERDERPHFFVGVLILKWLSERSLTPGPTRLKGFHPIGLIREDLARFGVEMDAFHREVEHLVRSFCINSEDFRSENLTDSDLISISPAGVVHLQISSEPYYLAAVAEDTWFDTETVAAAIAERIKHPIQHYQARTALLNASDVLDYLIRMRALDADAYNSIYEDKEYEKYVDLTNSSRSVERLEKSIVSPNWVGMQRRYPVGCEAQGQIVNVKNFGIFVQLEENIDGLIHSSVLPPGFASDPSLARGNSVAVRVLELDQFEGRISLGLVSAQSQA